MNRTNLALIVTILTLIALTAGCTDTTTNTNTGNANATNANANTNANAAANSNANANSNSNTSAPLSREEIEKKKDEYAKEAKQLGRKIGAGASDTWLWVKTRTELAAVDDLRDSTINVDVDNGVITLTGTVASREQSAKADSIAKAVDGQKGVVNKLKVVPEGANSNENKNNSTGNSKSKKG